MSHRQPMPCITQLSLAESTVLNKKKTTTAFASWVVNRGLFFDLVTPYNVSCLQCGTRAWQHCNKAVIGTPATCGHTRDMTLVVKSNIMPKQKKSQK